MTTIISFPAAPADGQQYVDGDVTYVYSAADATWLVLTDTTIRRTYASGNIAPGSIGTVEITDGDVLPVDLDPALLALINGAIQADGSSTVLADIPLNGFSLTGLRAAVANGEPIRFEEFMALSTSVASNAATLAGKLPLDGSLPMNGSIDMGAGLNTVRGLRAAAASGEAVRYDEHTIDGLTDTTIAGLANRDALMWDGAQWVNRPLQLDDISDALGNGSPITTVDPGADRIPIYDASLAQTVYVTPQSLGAGRAWQAGARQTADTWGGQALSDILFSFSGNAAAEITLGTITGTRVVDAKGFVSDGTNSYWIGSTLGWSGDVSVFIDASQNVKLAKPTTMTSGEILVVYY